MSSAIVIVIILVYFGLLIFISHLTSRNADSNVFFTANRQSPWFLVAFGMIGASLSGVTFISVPGEVGNSSFAYFQVVLGYLVGYLVIGTVLLPLYYRLNLVSIYTYLQQRFGFWSYKTGAIFFIISRTIGSAFRLFLVATVLQIAVFDAWNVPFELTVIITIFLIWIYTFRGGIKTIVWTDTLQTFFMLSAVGASIYLIANDLDLSFYDLLHTVRESEYSKIFHWDWRTENNFFKQFLSGAFIAIVMTGLDQDMMQKNLTCRSLKDAQKNVFWFSVILVIANLMFLSLGALLFIYAKSKGVTIPERTDELYPLLAINHFTIAAGLFFILGIIAAAYSSADSALTALTTSFCVDILNFNEKTELVKKKIRIRVHLMFSVLLLLVIIVFRIINNDSVITSVFRAAGYTYGPILGLFAFGLFTRFAIKDRYVLIVAILSPILSFLLDLNSAKWFLGYKIGFEILIINGLLTFLGLLIINNGIKPPDLQHNSE
ncbi:MAG: sodium:solute symporter [Cyclobacteriaceae bacterium]